MKECPSCVVSVENSYSVCWNCSYNFNTKKIEGFVSNDIDIKSDHVKLKKIDCLRCKTTMIYKKNIKFQEGKDSGILRHLLTEHTSFDIYICPNCYKVELFLPELD